VFAGARVARDGLVVEVEYRGADTDESALASSSDA
jgi:hypothetical protein